MAFLFGKPNATMDEIINAAKMANIHQDIINLENGYNSIVGENGAFLSGGQRQRIAIARCYKCEVTSYYLILCHGQS
jgi:ABC-type bacteriocin/lantibiotic exporter with double-glycine peptidase domain